MGTLSGPELSRFQRFYLWMHILVMKRLEPQDKPGPLLRWLFKLPLHTYNLGFGLLFGNRILLLTTRGRKSGVLRTTALEYSYDPKLDEYKVMSGWGGKTDWVKNIRTCPEVTVQAGRRKFQGLAEPVPEEEIAIDLAEAVRLNPRALKIWSRWAGRPVDSSPASLMEAARTMPAFRIKPFVN